MTEQDQNRKSDGKYTFANHAPSPVTVGTPTRRPELDGWPESLPEPEVTVSFSEGSGVTTNVSINGEPLFEVWNPAEDISDTENSSFVNALTEDESVHEAAEGWARDKHNEIADAVRAETVAAFQRVQAGILAKATGQAPPAATDEDLTQTINDGFTAANAARRDAEYASAALLSRGVLAEHPDAAYIDLDISGADNGEYVSGAAVFNGAGEQIGSYDEDDVHTVKGDGRPDRPFLRHLNDLTAIPENSHWTAFNVTPVWSRDDFFKIDLKKASSWAPGVEV